MNVNDIFTKTDKETKLATEEIVYLLNLEGEELQELYIKADKVRDQYMGNKIFLRGILEISNYCKKNCNYCGIRGKASNVTRYRIPTDEIMEACHQLIENGMTTVVLQAGEDPKLTKEYIGELVSKIKRETDLAVTLSLGEFSKETYAYWKDTGMDRYLLRYETSDPILFKNCHPDDDFDTRIQCLKDLRDNGTQVGSGMLIGIPNQTIEGLANELLFCTNLDLDMIGIGPFIPSPNTPFQNECNPFDKEVFFKVISIMRLLNHKAHIPSTTAFDAIQPNGRNLLLKRGANVFMPNATPQKYRKDYQLYPNKPCVDEGANDCANCVKNRILAIGREIGTGPGHSIK